LKGFIQLEAPAPLRLSGLYIADFPFEPESPANLEYGALKMKSSDCKRIPHISRQQFEEKNSYIS
jgi:hypothetical protein